MKHLTTAVAILLAFATWSQYCPALGPDQLLPCGQASTTLTADLSQCGAGTNPRQTTAYTVSNIPYAAQTNTGTQLFMSDDSQQGPFNIGFNFCFFGQTYTQFWVGSNGWISFSGAQPTTFTSQTVPTAAATVPKNCIMGPWQDWHPGLGGQIRYQVSGAAPCRKLVVSWAGVPMFSCTSNFGTFHIVINETTNTIENFIQDKPACLQWSGGTAVEGIHNAAGTVAVTVPGRNSTAWTATNDAWQWTPNGPTVTPTLTWYQVGVAAPIGTGASITVTPPAAGASYTCRFVYPTCNAGWSTCNAGAGPGPDTVFVLPGTPIPTVTPIVSEDTVCWPPELSSYVTTSQPGVVLQWDAIGIITSGQGTDSITVDWSTLSPGVLPGAVQVTPILNGCAGLTASFDLFILNIDPIIQTQDPLCEYDDVVDLVATPAGGQFAGSGVIGTTFDPSIAVGTNVITYEYELSGCEFDTTTQIVVHPTPVLDSITPYNSFYELCELDVANIVWSAESTPTGGYWQWVWQGDTTQQTALGETLTWNMEGMNTVSVTYYANGCVSNTQTATVTILQCPETLIWIPNTFTPDGNEWNNVWQPVFTSGFDPAEFSLFVMNRWGETVWESRDVTVAWDGTYHGRLCQDGVYFYMITYGDPDTDSRSTIQGHITLIR